MIAVQRSDGESCTRDGKVERASVDGLGGGAVVLEAELGPEMGEDQVAGLRGGRDLASLGGGEVAPGGGVAVRVLVKQGRFAEEEVGALGELRERSGGASIGGEGQATAGARFFDADTPD